MNSSEGKNTVPDMPRAEKVFNSMRWLPAYIWQRMTRTLPRVGQRHLIFALADHFEPSFLPRHAGQVGAPRRAAATAREMVPRLSEGV